MRKETRTIVSAFLAGRPAKGARTHTDGKTLYLHGNRIAYTLPGDGAVFATLAGWPTRTTMDRLNGLCALLGQGGGFYTRKGVPHFNGAPVGSREHVLVGHVG